MEKSQIITGLVTGLLIVNGQAFAAESEGESVFSPITITDNPLAENAGQVGSSEESHTRPGAYSSRTLNKNLQSLDARCAAWRAPIRKSTRCRAPSASISAA